MMLVDQTTQMVSSLIFGIMTIASIIQRSPLINTIGSTGCWFFWIVMEVHNLSLLVGGWGMGLFRFIGIKITNMRPRSVMKVILVIEGVLFSITFLSRMMFGYHLDTNTPIALCRGYTRTVEITIREVMGSGDMHHLKTLLILTDVLMVYVFLCSEMAIYIN